MYRLCYIKNLFYFADKGMAQGNMAGPERYKQHPIHRTWGKKCSTTVLNGKIDFTYLLILLGKQQQCFEQILLNNNIAKINS